MTDLEILQDSINRLNNINVPVAFIEEIGVPIHNVSKNLQVLLNTIVKVIKDKEAETDGGTAESVPETGNGSDPS